jgi:hypothetical protein
MQNRRTSETQKLRSIFSIPFASLLAAKPGDEISGWNEMQGYPDGYDFEETVGQFLARTGQTPGAAWGARGRTPAPFAPRGPMLPPMRPGQNMARPPAPQLNPLSVQAGQSMPGTLLSYMGLGSHTFLPAAATSTSFDVEPQSAFRGRRLVISQAKTAGASGILVTVSTALTVSGMPQTPNPAQPAPAEMFSPDATYSMLDLQIATSGTSINIGISISAVPAADNSVSVAAGLYGEWIR